MASLGYELLMAPCIARSSAVTLKTKGCQFDNFVVTGGTVSCRNDNLQRHQWRQSSQIDDLLFSVDDINHISWNPHQFS